MFLKVEHTTRYTYESSVKFSRNDVRLKPRPHPKQTLHSFSLAVDPSADIREREDYFGNVVHRCNVKRQHNTLRIHVDTEVITASRSVNSTATFQDLDHADPAFQEFLYATDLIPLDKNWLEEFELNRPDPTDSIVEYLNYLMDCYDDRFAYDQEATTVETDLKEFADGRSGVCQDFAHSLAAICRELNLPARYVSGYVHSGQGSEATHAWVDVHLPDVGWVGLDPTNHQFVDDQYVVIGFGRDYTDCSPVDGIRRGGGADRMSIEVQVERLPEERRSELRSSYLS